VLVGCNQVANILSECQAYRRRGHMWICTFNQSINQSINQFI